MSKLSDIIFQTISLKEFDVQGHKVKLRALTTKDTIEMNVSSGEKFESPAEVLKFAVKVLSKSLVSVDGIAPESEVDAAEFLNNQAPDTTLTLLNSYQEITTIKAEEIKN